MLGELVHLVLAERPDHDRRQEPREDEGGVAVRLAARELELSGGQEERHPPELRDPDLERDARPRRRLVEDQPDRSTGEHSQLGSARALGLELVGEIQQGLELVPTPVRHAREVATLEASGTPGIRARYGRVV